MTSCYVWLCCLAVVLSIHGCCGEDGGNCSYLYEGHTSRIECPSGNGGTIINCVVTVIRDFPTEIRWYQSQDEASAGVGGSLVEEQPGKYTLLENLATSSSVGGLFQDEYQLEISNINEDDVGYYWCQIVVNVSCNSANTTILLESSDPWNITIGTLFLDCTGMDSTLPKCAETNDLSMPCGGSLETTVFVSTRSITPTLPIPPTTATLSQNSLFGMSGLSPSQTTTVRPDPEQTPSTASATSSCGGVSCFVYGAIGAAVLVVAVMCVVVVLLVVVCVVRNGKKMKNKGEPGLQQSQTVDEQIALKPLGGHEYVSDGHPVTVSNKRNEIGQHEYERVPDHETEGHKYASIPGSQPTEKATGSHQLAAGEHEYDSIMKATKRAASESREPNPPEPFYHVIEGPTPLSNTDKQHDGISPSAKHPPSTEDEYDQPIHQNSKQQYDRGKALHEYGNPGEQPLAAGPKDTASPAAATEPFYYVLEGPSKPHTAPGSREVYYSSPGKPAAVPVKSREHDYDEPDVDLPLTKHLAAQQKQGGESKVYYSTPKKPAPTQSGNKPEEHEYDQPDASTSSEPQKTAQAVDIPGLFDDAIYNSPQMKPLTNKQTTNTPLGHPSQSASHQEQPELRPPPTAAKEPVYDQPKTVAQPQTISFDDPAYLPQAAIPRTNPSTGDSEGNGNSAVLFDDPSYASTGII